MKNRGAILLFVVINLHSLVLLAGDFGMSTIENEFRGKGRSIEDVVVDSDGMLHVVSSNTILNNVTPDPGVLFYSKIDTSGVVLSDVRITKHGSHSSPRIDVDLMNEAFAFYCSGSFLFYAKFDKRGVMLTPMDYYFTEKELGGSFDYDLDDSNELYVLGRTNYDYFLTLDKVGNKVNEVRSRLLAMVSSDGFAITMLDTSRFLLVWHEWVSDEKRREGYFRTDSLKYMTVATDLKGASTVHSVALEQVAVAEISEDLQLATPKVLRTRDGVRVVTGSGKTGSTSKTMVVTFDSTGTLVPRSPLEHITRKEVIHASAAGSGVVLHAIHDIYGRAVKPFVLYGFTPDGQVVVHDSSRQK